MRVVEVNDYSTDSTIDALDESLLHNHQLGTFLAAG